MTKLSNDKVELGKGKKVKLGSNSAYEVWHNPVTDQLEIIDTSNNSRAFVDKEDRGQIGGNGTFIKALKNGEPMADTGKTYSTVQGAVDAASSWVFVPPGTYNESVTVETEGLTLRGAGYNTHIDGGTIGTALDIKGSDVNVSNLSVKTNSGGGNNYAGISSSGERTVVEGCWVRDSDGSGIVFGGDYSRIVNCKVEGADDTGLYPNGEHNIAKGCIVNNIDASGIKSYANDTIVVNNIIFNAGNRGIRMGASSDNVVGGNRIHNSTDDGIRTGGNSADNILFNNRVSDSGGTDIESGGTGDVTDGNLTGAAN
jgi:parallel beta-helix repeat protein